MEKLCQKCGSECPEQESEGFSYKVYPRNMEIKAGDYWITGGLEKIMLPLTLKNRIRYYRDNFDKPVLNGLLVFNRMLRTCEQFNIPSVYGAEAMRLMLKRNKGLYSRRKQLATLIETLQTNPRLYNRIPQLTVMMQEAKGN
jgi:hypothetical protein